MAAGGFNSVDAGKWLGNGQPMTKSRQSDRMPDLDALEEIVGRFEAARSADPGLADAELGDLIRLVPGKRAVIRGRIGGRACVWRMFMDPLDDVSSREWEELQRIWPEMQGKRFRVVEPLRHNAEHRLLAIEEVEGTPLLELVRAAPEAARAGLVTPAADWLRRYTESTESWVPAKPVGWLKRAERASATQPFARLHKLETQLIAQMTRLAERIEGLEWRVAISHGDFHPNNLIVEGERMTGIDTGGSGRMPIYKDIARFAMHMGRRGVIPSGRRMLGVDGALLDAFTDAFAMTEAERRCILPFMLGVDALLRVETRALSKSRIRRAGEMYEALIEDMSGL
jgi:Ser/Thr protein kinase RdoA (MazF antagonist)